MMNYYPYYNNYNTQQQTAAMPAYAQMQPQTMMPATSVSAGINGKVVDGEEVVKATEVPFGGYGIFPKADLSEIYMKSWNNNGTTQIVTFKPTNTKDVVDTQTVLLEKINNIETTLNSLVGNQKSTPAAKEGVKVNNAF
jgi:hypothetical protein